MKAKKLIAMALLTAVVGSTPVTAHAASVSTIPLQNGPCNEVTCVVISNIENYCPDTSAPDTNQSDTSTPDTSQPDTNQPDTSTPDTSQPDTNQPDTSTPDAETLSYAEQVVKLVNEERAKAGLSALTMQTDITSAANVRANEIKQSFSHTRPNGSSFSSVLKEQGVSFTGAGENIAYGQKTPEQVMESWMNSSGHRANILNANFKNIGVGYYQDAQGVNYWVQLFTY